MEKYVPSGYIILNIGEVAMENNEYIITDKKLQEKIDYALKSKKPVLLTIHDTSSDEGVSGFCINDGVLLRIIVYATIGEILSFAVTKLDTTYKATRVYQEAE